MAAKTGILLNLLMFNLANPAEVLSRAFVNCWSWT